jgi:hypothetical protein
MQAIIPISDKAIAITVGWNMLFNPYNTALEYDGTHFSFKKTGSDASISLDECVNLSDYVVIGNGNGNIQYVPDDIAAIPAHTGFMLHSDAAGELTIKP